jgi:hypothetical protein
VSASGPVSAYGPVSAVASQLLPEAAEGGLASAG